MGAMVLHLQTQMCCRGMDAQLPIGDMPPTRGQAHGERNVSGCPGRDRYAVRRHVRHVVTWGISLWEGLPSDTLLTERITHRLRLLVRAHLAVDDAATAAMLGPA